LIKTAISSISGKKNTKRQAAKATSTIRLQQKYPDRFPHPCLSTAWIGSGDTEVAMEAMDKMLPRWPLRIKSKGVCQQPKLSVETESPWNKITFPQITAEIGWFVDTESR
jgi:hypothetical protein